MQADEPQNASKNSRIFTAACMILILSFVTFDSLGENGVVPLIQMHFLTTDSQTAFMRTTSSLSSTVMLALVWILGDFFNRRKLFISSVATWIASSLISISLGSQSFLIFVAFRALSGAAAVVFEVLTPVMLAEMFEERALGIALMCVTGNTGFAGMLSTIATSWIVTNGVPWQTGLTVGPLLSIFLFLGMLCSRWTFRSSEKIDQKRGVGSIFSSAFGLFSIKSFILMVAAATFAMLNAKAYIFWLPTYYLSAWSIFPDVFYYWSYTTIITINSTTTLVASSIGLPLILWFAQSWRHGTGLFFDKKGSLRAYPIVVCVSSTINVAMSILSILLIDKSYIACLAVTFLVGFGAAANACLGQQMMLMVVPSSSRAAAVALSLLIPAVAGIPSAQLIGLISDAFRGDSTLPLDRFRAYQLGLLCSASLLVFSALCYVLLVFFFPRDCERAEEKEKQEEQTVNEKTSLMGKTKGRSDSLLEDIVKSRSATLTGYFG